MARGPVARLGTQLALGAALTLLAQTLQGCGSSSSSDPASTTATTTAGPNSSTSTTASTTVTTTTTVAPDPTAHCLTANPDGSCATCQEGFTLTGTRCSYKCLSELADFEVVSPEKKGMCLDDTTFQSCTDRIPSFWPNTDVKMASLRIFSAWQGFWPDEGREQAWKNLAAFVRANNVRVLMGTQITCNETDDDRDWTNVKTLMQLIGPEHIMGVAIGNELELLYTKDYVRADKTCIPRIWKGGYFWRKTAERVAELDKLGDNFLAIPITSVFGGFALAGNPFVEFPDAMVNSYLYNATRAFGSRWAFTLNIYPYFDPNNQLDPGTRDHCSAAIGRCTCWDSPSCLMIGTMQRMREKMQQLTHRNNDTLWIGENGWSFPASSTLNTPVRTCANFSSRETFMENYKRFLEWDLTVPGMKGPDHIFYFTMRDSSNFGLEEHFGLVGTCLDTSCKLQPANTTNSTTSSPEMAEVVV